MAKKKKKQKIRIYFRDGKKDIIPQKFWTDYDFIAKDSGTYFVVIKKRTMGSGIQHERRYRSRCRVIK